MINQVSATRGVENLNTFNLPSIHQSAIGKQQFSTSQYLDEMVSKFKKKILLVDNDADLRAQLNATLTNEGYLVEEADSALEMDSVLNEFEADMILLDVMLPDENGLSIIKRLKKNRSLDMIILSTLSGVEDRIEGLSSGAAYYLSKPVDMRELLAVINNRFKSRKKQDTKQEKKWVLQINEWIFTTPDGEEFLLNNTEFTILSLLAKHARLGKVTTKEELYEALGKKYLPQSRSLDLHLSRLRKRFSKNCAKFPLRTLRNIGYELTEVISVSFK